MIWQWIIPPLIGCVIGYITNAIAIKMLFRPHRAYYIGRFHVPLTPGVIPRNKDRLGAAIGDVVSRELLNAEVVEQALANEEMLMRVGDAFDGFIEDLSQRQDSLHDVLDRYLPVGEVDLRAAELEDKITTMLHQRLVAADLGTVAAQAITEHVLKKSPSVLKGMVNGLMDPNKRHSITGQLREALNRYIEEGGYELLHGMIAKEADGLMTKPIADFLTPHEEKIPALREQFLRLYQQLIRSGTERILSAVDIGRIVRERIASFDSVTVEKLVMEVMNRELRAIIWLGALLGFLMGFVNYLLF